MPPVIEKKVEKKSETTPVKEAKKTDKKVKAAK